MNKTPPNLHEQSVVFPRFDRGNKERVLIGYNPGGKRNTFRHFRANIRSQRNNGVILDPNADGLAIGGRILCGPVGCEHHLVSFGKGQIAIGLKPVNVRLRVPLGELDRDNVMAKNDVARPRLPLHRGNGGNVGVYPVGLHRESRIVAC